MGDPSGRGIAISYVKNMRRRGLDPVNRLLPKQDAAAITGTQADLRKLGNAEAGKLLVEKFDINRDIVKSLDRWRRIDALRQLSTAALAQGVDLGELGTMFARNVKVSMDEMRQRQFKAGEVVIARQMRFLRDGVLPDASADADEDAPLGDPEQVRSGLLFSPRIPDTFLAH